jgi:flagellar assembly factor FliW
MNMPEPGAVNGEENHRPKNVICLPFGLPGFEGVKNYVLLTHPEERPLLRLQMLEGEKRSFQVAPTLLVLPDYQPELSDHDVEFLELTEPADAMVLNIVTLGQGQATINLKVPIVINRHSLIGKQIIPKNANRFDLRYPMNTVLK